MKTQISRRIMERLAMLLVAFLTVGALTVAAHADNLVAKVKGKGIADMVATDDTFFPDANGIPTADEAYPINTEFKDNHFAIKANVHADGYATGTARFVFGDEFSNAWLVDAITLECEIDTGSVSEDGTVVLQGFSFETDFDGFGNVVFEELTPCEIIIDPAGSFSLEWCSIPALNVNGHLEVN
ncbi:MAG TPA: hypothetical protein VNU68_16045 [Verrucomicrobiae bacterium]|nr:hypothetical protein [Verrucomicrobiae bacterium]